MLDLADSRAYQTPEDIMSHIPESANPGERGSAWFFGHQVSSVARDRNELSGLNLISSRVRKGQDTYAFIENVQTCYVYRIMSTSIMRQDDMTIFDTGDPTIHLVIPVPRWSYDHRLTVTGKLVGTLQLPCKDLATMSDLTIEYGLDKIWSISFGWMYVSGRA